MPVDNPFRRSDALRVCPPEYIQFQITDFEMIANKETYCYDTVLLRSALSARFLSHFGRSS